MKLSSECGRIFEPDDVFSQFWNIATLLCLFLDSAHASNMDPENAGRYFLPESYWFILSSWCNSHSGVVIHDKQGPMTSRWWEIMVLSFLYRENCTKFGQLIVRKIIKIVDSKCQILWLKFTKFDFGWGSAPDPAREAYSAPLDPLAGVRGLLLRGGRG